MKCDVDIQIYTPCRAVNGTTLFQGMVERMMNQLTALAPSTMRARFLLRFRMDWSSILSTSSQTETSSLSFRTFPVARKCCSSLFYWYTSQRNPLHFFPKCDVDIRKESYASVVLTSGTTMFRETVERMNERIDGVGFRSRRRSRCLPHQCESTQYGLEDLSCPSPYFQQVWTSRASAMYPPSIVHRCRHE